ncbi:hypothetical protein KR032_004982 [Drosophila birchii]|nr:hypothetical protein KR032_004982 [Drosophila birchii]
MVRRRLLSSSAKQASMSAYQNFWRQQQQPQQQPPQSLQQRAQNPLLVPVPQYWPSVCNKLGGAAPSQSRRQLVQPPREAMLPLQKEYQQTMWGRCCGSQGTLLKPGAIMPTFPHLGYPQVPARAVPTVQPQRSFQYQQRSLLGYPAAVPMQQMPWQQQHQPPHRPVPVGILKKTSQHECAGVHNAKRVTIKAPARFQPPTVEPVKPKPEVPRRPSKRMRQPLLRREQQKVLQQIQKQQQEQKELQKQQKIRRRLQRKLDHQRALQKQQHQLELERQTNQFNFGKIASSFLDNPADSEMCMSQRPQSPSRNHNFCYQEAKRRERPEVSRQREGNPYSSLYKDSPDLGSGSSTITLTTEHSQVDCKPAEAPTRSGTSLVDKSTNTQIDPLGELLKQVPLRATMGKGSSKLNINELLRSEQVKGLNADPMCQSLMQLVALMCESKEKQADPRAQSRLRAGSGGDAGGLRKKYSVYLMVSSENEDEGEFQVKSEQNSSNITGDERTQDDDEEFSQRCANAYQEEYPKFSRRKRTRKRFSSRLDDLDSYCSSPMPLLPMRRPLHWPKPDYSKLSQGRSNRTPLRIRSRSSSKQMIQMRSQRSVCSVLDPKRSWKLWEDLPMTAKTLNKAYSRLWGLSGGQSCTKF